MIARKHALGTVPALPVRAQFTSDLGLSSRVTIVRRVVKSCCQTWQRPTSESLLPEDLRDWAPSIRGHQALTWATRITWIESLFRPTRGPTSSRLEGK